MSTHSATPTMAKSPLRRATSSMAQSLPAFQAGTRISVSTSLASQAVAM